MKNKICEQDPQKHVMCEQVSIFATQITCIKPTVSLTIYLTLTILNQTILNRIQSNLTHQLHTVRGVTTHSRLYRGPDDRGSEPAHVHIP